MDAHAPTPTTASAFERMVATVTQTLDGSRARRDADLHLAGGSSGFNSSDLCIDRVHKSFGSNPVLRDVSFTVPAGQFLTLLGPSGCGKTTLLRIIAGLERADRGEVKLGDRRLCDLPANRRPVNMVFQSYALFPHMRVFENVAFGLRSRGLANGEVARRVGPALDMLRISHLADRFPPQLSGGERQRTALARALVNEPAVLLLDEPMSALDAKLRAEVQVELRRIQQRLGRTFILVTHDQDEALTVSDRIVVMHAGRIEQEGTPSEVYDRPNNRFVAGFLGAANLIPGQKLDGIVRTELGDLTPAREPQWERGTLVIRPERIRIRSTAPARNGVRGRVVEVIYRGPHQEVLVEPGSIRVHAPVTQRWTAGDRVFLELPSEHVEILVD